MPLSGPEHGLISRQVLREYIGAVTRPQQWSAPVTLAKAIADTDAFERLFTVAEDGPDVWNRFRGLCAAHVFGGKQVHDACLAATVLAHGASRLLTFNARHFRRFAPLIEVVEP